MERCGNGGSTKDSGRASGVLISISGAPKRRDRANSIAGTRSKWREAARVGTEKIADARLSTTRDITAITAFAAAGSAIAAPAPVAIASGRFAEGWRVLGASPDAKHHSGNHR